MPGLIDLSTLDHLFKADRSRVNEWLRLYLEEAPGIFAQLKSAQQDGDAEALTRAAHELRPQAHYLGAPRMLELLSAVSEGARKNGAAACKATVDELLRLAEQVEAELHTVVGEL